MTLSAESISYQATNFAVTKDSYLRFTEKEHGIMAWAAVIYIFYFYKWNHFIIWVSSYDKAIGYDCQNGESVIEYSQC